MILRSSCGASADATVSRAVDGVAEHVVLELHISGYHSSGQVSLSPLQGLQDMVDLAILVLHHNLQPEVSK